MNAPSLRFAVLANALLLGLPPGWCSALPTGKGQPLAVQPTCCLPSSGELPAGADPVPTNQGSDCCCRWQATVSQQFERPSNDVDLDLLASTVLAESLLQSHAESTGNVASRAIGPPLRVLHCVWRC